MSGNCDITLWQSYPLLALSLARGQWALW